MRTHTAKHSQYSNRLAIVLAALLVSLAASATDKTAATEQAITFLVIPVVSNALVNGFYGGLAAQVNSHTGRKISFHFPSSYCETIRHAAESSQEYDMIYLPPHVAPMMMRQRGFIPIIVSNNPVLGVFAFRDEPRDSNRPFKIALGGEHATTSFAARKTISELLRRNPSTADIELAQVEFVDHSTHDQALVSFYKGRSDAVAVVDLIFNRSADLFKNEVKSFVFSAEYPRVVLLVRPGLDQRTQRQLTSAFSLAKGALPKSDPFAALDLKPVGPATHQRLLAMPDANIAECLASDKEMAKPFSFLY